MQTQVIRAVVVRVGQQPVVEEVPNDLAALEAIVGGYVEVLVLPGGLTLWCNEEGRQRNLRPNRLVMSATGPDGMPVPDLAEEVRGDFCVTRADEGGEAVSVAPADLAAVKALLLDVRPRALVLEDYELKARSLVRRLRRDGYEVCVAETAEHAIRILLDVMVYDFASLDFNTGPGATGLDVAITIAALPMDVRPKRVEVHSSDDAGAERMLRVLTDAGVDARRAEIAR